MSCFITRGYLFISVLIFEVLHFVVCAPSSRLREALRCLRWMGGELTIPNWARNESNLVFGKWKPCPAKDVPCFFDQKIDHVEKFCKGNWDWIPISPLFHHYFIPTIRHLIQVQFLGILATRHLTRHTWSGPSSIEFFAQNWYPWGF